MRHANKNRTLSRSKDQRTSLLRGLMVSLIRDEKIETTLGKAKELQPYIERVITSAKTDSIQNRRLVASRLGQPADTVTKKVFGELAPKFKDRNGGYTRIIKMGRAASGRDQVLIAFVE